MQALALSSPAPLHLSSPLVLADRLPALHHSTSEEARQDLSLSDSVRTICFV